MKRSLRFAVIVVVSVPAIVASVPWILGLLVEAELRDFVEDSGEAIAVESYERGYRKSTVRMKVRLAGDEETSFILRHEITHGVLGKGSLNRVKSSTMPCLARISTTWEQAESDRVSPLRFETTISFGGDKFFVGTLDPVNDHSHFRTGGGSCSLLVSDERNSASGFIRVESVEFGMRKGGGTHFALGPIVISMNAEKNGVKRADATLESLVISSEKTEAWSQGGIESIDSATGEPNDSLGIAILTAEEKNSIVNGDRFEMVDARFAATHSVKRDFHMFHCEFSADSAQTTFLDLTEMRHYSRLMEDGMSLNFGVRLSHDIVDAWKQFDPGVEIPSVSSLFGERIHLNAEQKKAAIRLIEVTLENFSGWNEAYSTVKIGTKAEQVAATLVFGYFEEGAITEQKTVADIFRVCRLLLNLNITKAALTISPEIADELRYLVADGILIEEGDRYVYRSQLEDGELKINHEPSRILQQLSPMLEQEIQWDSAFLGE